jgi:hypothetical protein
LHAFSDISVVNSCRGSFYTYFAGCDERPSNSLKYVPNHVEEGLENQQPRRPQHSSRASTDTGDVHELTCRELGSSAASPVCLVEHCLLRISPCWERSSAYSPRGQILIYPKCTNISFSSSEDLDSFLQIVCANRCPLKASPSQQSENRRPLHHGIHH